MSVNSLTIVIPALNEEDAIGQTLSRCLDARQEILETAGLTTIEVIVVSDGWTDRTVEIAQTFEEVEVIVFEKNRGYGAAIKEGGLESTEYTEHTEGLRTCLRFPCVPCIPWTPTPHSVKEPLAIRRKVNRAGKSSQETRNSQYSVMEVAERNCRRKSLCSPCSPW